jgi:hypothetical protein
MTDKTLNEYINKLRPVQQEFICFCIREHGNRPDMHRGLLPFLSVLEADRCLKEELIRKQMPENRFIRQCLSVFSDAVPHMIATDEESVVMSLNSKKLMRHFRVYRNDFFVFSGGVCIGVEHTPVQMERINYNQWRVRCSRKYQHTITTWLADKFR